MPKFDSKAAELTGGVHLEPALDDKNEEGVEILSSIYKQPMKFQKIENKGKNDNSKLAIP